MSTVTFKGTETKIGGQFPEVGQTAPDFTLTEKTLESVKLSNFAGKRKILSIFPSVDTGVCAASARKFNEEASKIDNTVILGISADLPFAQARFCAAEGLDNVKMLSTFKNSEFLTNYGVALQSGPIEGLAARAVIVLDENNKVLYTQLVPEITQEPDYESAKAALAR